MKEDALNCGGSGPLALKPKENKLEVTYSYSVGFKVGNFALFDEHRFTCICTCISML